MKNNLIYYIMTYVMYLYPPFIYGMVMINFGRLSNVRYWVTGIIVDIVFVLITTAVLFVLAIKKKIPKIEKDEKTTSYSAISEIWLCFFTHISI